MTKQARFFATPTNDPKNGAHVGGIWAGRYAYVNGYYLAARVLAKRALEDEPRELLFYPICFNFRHCIELHLKALVQELEALHAVKLQLGEGCDPLPTKPKRMMQSHSLIAILSWVEQALAVFTEERINQGVRETIAEIERHDYDGQGFRYHERTDGSPTLSSVSKVDIRKQLKTIDTTHFHLLGVDCWLADLRATAEALLIELEPDWI